MTQEAMLEKVMSTLKEIYPDKDPVEVLYELSKYLKDNPDAALYVQAEVNF